MHREDLVRFLRRYRLAVEASVAPGGAPQAAVVGFAVSDALEIVFDTVTTSRKYANLRADPRIALVIGWERDHGPDRGRGGLPGRPRARARA